MPRFWFGFGLSYTSFVLDNLRLSAGTVAIGDTLRNPKFLNGSKLQTFDLVAANPMWNQDGYGGDFYEGDTYGRFSLGPAPTSSADWGWGWAAMGLRL